METTQNNLKKKHQHQTAAAPSKSTTQKQLKIHNHANIDVQNKKNCLSEQEMKLAGIAINLNVRLRASDMPVSMQEHALRYTRSLFDYSGDAPPSHHRLSPTFLACSLKKEFDGVYGPAWHCVVGKSFGSFVTHSAGGFVYFSLDSLSFLLFKTEVQLIKVSPLPRRPLELPVE